jgi:hypothetical protein
MLELNIVKIQQLVPIWILCVEIDFWFLITLCSFPSFIHLDKMISLEEDWFSKEHFIPHLEVLDMIHTCCLPNLNMYKLKHKLNKCTFVL